ncbi:hypothetical protein KC906_01935 [Candidatus Kaiserbacteria bacterium]|nr:hypothetical protein [Candidatus Kaiserbacteria bacterium]
MQRVPPIKELTRESLEVIEGEFPELKLLNTATLGESRGFEITKERICEITGLNDECKDWSKLLRLWKASVLYLNGIDVVYMAKIRGYRFLTVEEHLGVVSDKRMASVQKRLKAHAHKLLVMRDGDLTDHQSRLRQHLAHQAHDTAGKLESQRAMAIAWRTRPESIPRVGPPVFEAGQS